MDENKIARYMDSDGETREVAVKVDDAQELIATYSDLPNSDHIKANIPKENLEKILQFLLSINREENTRIRHLTDKEIIIILNILLDGKVTMDVHWASNIEEVKLHNVSWLEDNCVKGLNQLFSAFAYFGNLPIITDTLEDTSGHKKRSEVIKHGILERIFEKKLYEYIQTSKLREQNIITCDRYLTNARFRLENSKSQDPRRNQLLTLVQDIYAIFPKFSEDKNDESNEYRHWSNERKIVFANDVNHRIHEFMNKVESILRS